MLLSEDPQQIFVPNSHQTLNGPLPGTGETVGEHPEAEAELLEVVKRQVADGESSIEVWFIFHNF